MINMRRNCRKNSSRPGSAPSTNPAMLLLPFANLLTKGRIKYGVTGLVRVRVRYRLGSVSTVIVRLRVSINIRLSLLHFIHLIHL